MPSARRVVTGVDGTGRSAVLADGAAPRSHDFAHIPGMSTTTLWATVAGDDRPYAGTDPTPSVEGDLPGPGETRFKVVTFPPDAVYAAPGFDGAAAAEENRRVAPDLAALFEPDDPAMHATDTLDYIVVLSGPINLELDDKEVVALATGDVVVQCGNRHAWRNPGDAPAVLAVVHVGGRSA